MWSFWLSGIPMWVSFYFFKLLIRATLSALNSQSTMNRWRMHQLISLLLTMTAMVSHLPLCRPKAIGLAGVTQIWCFSILSLFPQCKYVTGLNHINVSSSAVWHLFRWCSRLWLHLGQINISQEESFTGIPNYRSLLTQRQSRGIENRGMRDRAIWVSREVMQKYRNPVTS